MDWPRIDSHKTFREVEQEYNITEERDDYQPWDLGNHPCKPYYSKPEPDFVTARKEFDSRTEKFERKLKKAMRK